MATEGTLVLSSNRGRYAVGDPDAGPDLSSGRPIEIFLGGQWILGHVEHSVRYACEQFITVDSQDSKIVGQYVTGYYVAIAGGGICGLCCGMKVRTMP